MFTFGEKLFCAVFGVFLVGFGAVLVGDALSGSLLERLSAAVVLVPVIGGTILTVAMIFD